MFKPDHIVIHHSASTDGNSLNKAAITRSHLTRGWDDIGYHAVVELVGAEYEVLIGRAPTTKGAHAIGLNDRSLGICFVGNFSMRTPSEQQLETGIHRWIVPTMKAYNIHPDRVLRHSDTKPTECPGKKFPWDWFKQEVKAAWIK